MRISANQRECGQSMTGASGECHSLCRENVKLDISMQACSSARESLEAAKVLMDWRP